MNTHSKYGSTVLHIEGFAWHCWRLEGGIVRISPEALDRYPIEELCSRAADAFKDIPQASPHGFTPFWRVGDLFLHRCDHCGTDILTLDVKDSKAFRRYVSFVADDGQNRTSTH